MGSPSPLNRRDFLKVGAAAGAGAVLAAQNAAATPRVDPFASVRQGAMTLPESPGFATKHLVVVILGNGLRTIDVFGENGHAPRQRAMAAEGTLFTEDYGDTAAQHGYLCSEMLTGRDAPAQRPLYPTWNEYVRRKTGAGASDFWMLQPASYYRAWTWDVKHYSQHPHYGVRYGATSLTANKVFRPASEGTAREIVDRSLERALGHTAFERRVIEDFLADVRARKLYEIPRTKRPVLDGEIQVGDCRSIRIAGRILKAFKPRIITVQVLGLAEACADFGHPPDETGYERYLSHLETTDELLGELWAEIQADPYFRATTALVVRPDCGRDGKIDRYGQLGHCSGSYDAHTVWTMALGPDFPGGRVVRERVQRRDLAPTLTYLMSGESAEHATGHVRTQMFKDAYRLPRYVLPPTAETRSGIDRAFARALP